jgi:zinc protease
MKKLAYLLFLLFLLLILSIPLPSCVTVPERGTPESAASINSRELLPVDPAVKIGVLENGLTYYIRKNGVPERRAELRLVVNAGSILEDDVQLGLAHFLEHMAFNGTRDFEKQEIVDYLESIGMRFGPDLNAYTTYDETVYVLQVPTDRKDTLETAVHILDECCFMVPAMQTGTPSGICKSSRNFSQKCSGGFTVTGIVRTSWLWWRWEISMPLWWRA